MENGERSKTYRLWFQRPSSVHKCLVLGIHEKEKFGGYEVERRRS